MARDQEARIGVIAPGASCEVCGSGAPKPVHAAAEMMFGMGGTFSYRECELCGTLTLQNVPPDLRPYYPSDYYAFESPVRARYGRLPVGVGRTAMRAALSSPAAAETVAHIARRWGLQAPLWWSLLADLEAGLDASILDVGCGSGHRLRALQRYGFRRLVGCDVHLPPDTCLGGGIVFHPASVHEVPGAFDVVMFHHSFEHLPDPSGVMQRARSLLTDGGAVILRIPLAGSFAWRTYGTHWVQLDAPRHLFLLTPAAVCVLAKRAGFSVAKVLYDSDGLQFWGSEQYRLGIPLHDDRSVAVVNRSVFSDDRIRDWERRAEVLNRRGDGDQAAFLLRPLARSDR